MSDVADGVSEAEHLERVERQRAQALATIERVKNTVRAERHRSAGKLVDRLNSQQRAYEQGRRDATAVFRAALKGTT